MNHFYEAAAKNAKAHGLDQRTLTREGAGSHQGTWEDRINFGLPLAIIIVDLCGNERAPQVDINIEPIKGSLPVPQWTQKDR